MCHRNSLHCIVPPRLLERLLQHKDARVRASALKTLVSTARLRGQRELLARTFAPVSAGGLHRTIYDARHAFETTGKRVRAEGEPAAADSAVNDVYEGFGATYALYRERFGRDSIDGKGLALDGVVHYGDEYNNAFWNGARMVFGDGDGEIFIGFTKAIDVIGHELTHGVTEFTSALEYHGQSGALNESMSDVFGSLVKQYARRETAQKADWLIGAGILGPKIKGVALRSMKAPGTAFEGDDQPSTFDGYVVLPDTDAGDWGGVHTNSGIPNHAFYVLATQLGGNAWDAAGQIWYDTLLALSSTATFSDCASVSYQLAGQRFGEKSAEQQAVGNAWEAVKVPLASAHLATARRSSANGSHPLYAKLKNIAESVDEALELSYQ